MTHMKPNLKVDWQNKIAVVTGASSGIGAATAQRLAEKGLHVILLARRLDRLNDLADEINQNGGKADVITADLTQENDRLSAYQEIINSYGWADVLINNAGFGWYGYFMNMPWSTAMEMMQVNMSAVVHFTSLFLPGMKTRNVGHVINIGSISGSFPSQGVAIYSATKSFLDSFTTALYRELRGTQVHMSVVRAGPVITEFSEKAADLLDGLHLPTEHIGVTAEAVAGRIWGLIRKPRRVIYIPSYFRVTPWIELCFGWLVDRIGPLLLRRQYKP
jgi:short-subunit dehydrogenase